MAESPHILILVNKSLLPKEIEAIRENVGDALAGLFGKEFKVFDSHAWYKERFESCGDWQSWVWETVNGKDYHSRRPHFNGFAVASPRLGRANADIVKLALRNKKGVLYWSRDEAIQVVRSVTTLDADSWVDGWGVETSEIRSRS